ncbi:hypothetical protein [Leptospira weilii]|nr:hypothetical protein [Leptospira weilii]
MEKRTPKVPVRFCKLMELRISPRSLSQNTRTIATIRGDSDKIEWFWDTL